MKPNMPGVEAGREARPLTAPAVENSNLDPTRHNQPFCDCPHDRTMQHYDLSGLCEKGDVAYLDCPTCGGIVMVDAFGKILDPTVDPDRDNKEPTYGDEE